VLLPPHEGIIVLRALLETVKKKSPKMEIMTMKRMTCRLHPACLSLPLLS
jgi:hypothetical protein